MKKIISYLFCIVFYLNVTAQLPLRNDTIPWWKANNLRLIQVNLPAYEAATLDPDSLVKDLLDHSANTLIINAGGIIKVCYEYLNKPEATVEAHVREIGATLTEIFERAAREGLPTSVVADRVAAARFKN